MEKNLSAVDEENLKDKDFLYDFNKDKKIPWEDVKTSIELNKNAFTENKLIGRLGIEKGVDLIKFLSDGTVQLPGDKKIKLSKCLRDFQVEVVGGEKYETNTGNNFHFDLYNKEQLMGYLSYRFDFDSQSSFTRLGLDGFNISKSAKLNEVAETLVACLVELGKMTKVNVMDIPSNIFKASGLEYKEHEANGTLDGYHSFKMFLPENVLSKTDCLGLDKILKEEEKETTV